MTVAPAFGLFFLLLLPFYLIISIVPNWLLAKKWFATDPRPQFETMRPFPLALAIFVVNIIGFLFINFVIGIMVKNEWLLLLFQIIFTWIFINIMGTNIFWFWLEEKRKPDLYRPIIMAFIPSIIPFTIKTLDTIIFISQ